MPIQLTKRQQDVIEKLLAERPKTRKANHTLLMLAEQGFGTLIANHHICYSLQDFVDIERLIKKQSLTGINATPKTPDATANRLETAKQRINEKWSQASVFAQQILIVGMGCPIPLLAPTSKVTLTSQASSLSSQQSNTQTQNIPYEMAATPIGVLPTVLVDYLDIGRFNKLIIIENGQMMTHWWLWRNRLPDTWKNALLLYRGHGDNLTWLSSIMSKLPSNCEVLFSFDLDLSGLGMISQMSRMCSGNASVLLPHIAFTADPTMPLYNQPHKITQQIDRTPSHAIAKPLQPIFELLVNHNLALMQEHLFQDMTIQWHVLKL